MRIVPSISVIIPAYNAAGCVDRAIESALAQTYAPLEIVVIDDGSADNTAEIVARYPTPVRLLRQANGGPGAARNHGAREAKGEWLAMLDADDAWLPHKLETQRTYLSDPATGVVHSPDTSGQTGAPPVLSFQDVWTRNTIRNSSALIRRPAFEEVGGYDEDRALIGVEDWNLWLRIARTDWKIVLCPEPLHLYMPAEGNLTSQTERMLNNDIVCVDKIATLCQLDRRMVRSRKARLYEEAGRTFLNDRHLPHARRAFAAALRCEPSAFRLGWLLSSSIPQPVLDLRRRLVHGRQARTS